MTSDHDIDLAHGIDLARCIDLAQGTGIRDIDRNQIVRRATRGV